jgi:hypothetical protein
MNKLIAASLGTTLLVTALSSIALAAPVTPGLSPAVTQKHDDQVGMTRVVSPQQPRPDQSGIDRTFHPDDAHALTVDQLNAAWNAEVDRIMQKPVAGGG